MKKNAILLTFAILSLVCTMGFGQKITIGVKGGFSIPKLSGGSSDDPLSTGYSSRFAEEGGIYAEYHTNKKFSVSLGVEYSSQGGKKDKLQALTTPKEIPVFILPFPTPKYLYADYKSEAKINYVLIPLLARYNWRINPKSPVRIYAALGPFAGILLNAKQVISGGSQAIYSDPSGKSPITLPGDPTQMKIPFDKTVNIKDSLNRYNTGICGFVGISYSITKKHSIFLEAGGNYGFIAIQKGKGIGKNNSGAAVVTVGYAYTLQNKYYYRGRR